MSTEQISLSSLTFPFGPAAPAAPPVLAAPVPDADLAAAPAARPPWHDDLLRHRKQVVNRPRSADTRLMPFAAFGVGPASGGQEARPLVAPVGTFTYFVLRRSWVRPPAGGSRRAIVLAGYRAAVRRDAGGASVVLGGPDNNVCLYDLHFRPVANARAGGQILDVTRYQTLRIGLDLDAAAEAGARDEALRAGEPRLPAFWAGFAPDELPEAEDCPAARRLALAAVRPGEDGPTLPSLRALGGTVTAVEPGAEGGTAVGFGGTAENPDDVQILPRTAVLSPYVRPGVVIAPGAALGDFLPRRVYPSMNKVAELYGQDVAAWLLQEAAAAGDEVRDGLILRRVELCPSSLGRALRVFEDVRDLVGPGGAMAPQVFRARRPTAFQFDRGVVKADLFSLRPQWSRPFTPAGRGAESGVPGGQS